MYKPNNLIMPFKKRVYLSSPSMHGEEIKYMTEAYETNWMSTLGANIDAVEKIAAETVGVKYAVGLCNCTSAIHLAIKIVAEKIYGISKVGHGALEGKRVFCSDMTFCATVNPVIYENGIPVFVDTDEETWNMDPVALERAFELYPDTKIVLFAELYGFPGKVDVIKEICDKHNAILIEDAAEALGASLNGKMCGSFGYVSTLSYNGNKIITGSSGGCLLTDDLELANKARRLSTQSRDNAPWYQHSEYGFNYRMSNVIAGVIRGQYSYLKEHIRQKRAIYERYKEGLKDLPVKLNPLNNNSNPNFWLSCLIIDKEYMCRQIMSGNSVSYIKEAGKTCPTEILNVLESLNAEGRPIWKPMHLQPIYKEKEFVKKNNDSIDVGADIFERGCCLPSDNKMTAEEQDRIIEVIKRCFE